jgi:xanthine dehydrogenase accessory factor
LPEAVHRLDRETYFVVMTQGHATDIPVLKKIFETYPDAPFIGCMGSSIKAKKMKLELKGFGVSENHLERFRSPIGLTLGGNDPAEIAVSVAAQLLECRDLASANSKA